MKNKRQTGSFLSPKEKKTITEIASKDSTLSGKRARTLLLIDEGETHVGAADKTGLTLGQARYALVRFKKLGLSMFSKLSFEPGTKEPVSAPVVTKKNKKKKTSQKKSAPEEIKKKKKKDDSSENKKKKKLKKKKKEKKSQKGKKKK